MSQKEKYGAVLCITLLNIDRILNPFAGVFISTKIPIQFDALGTLPSEIVIKQHNPNISQGTVATQHICRSLAITLLQVHCTAARDNGGKKKKISHRHYRSVAWELIPF